MTQKGYEQIFKSIESQEPISEAVVAFYDQEFSIEYDSLPGIVAKGIKTRVDETRLVHTFRVAPESVSEDKKATRVGLFTKFATGLWVLTSEIRGEWTLKKGTPWSGHYNIQFTTTGSALDMGNKHVYRDGDSVLVVDDEGKVY